MVRRYGGIAMGKLIGTQIITMVNIMELPENGPRKDNLNTKHIGIMVNKLKNKIPGTHFFCLTTTMTRRVPKDLLNLVFQEIESGHDMLNFSEISRRCHQIFHQNLEVVTEKGFDCTLIFTQHRITGLIHGVYRRHWFIIHELYEANWSYGKWHGSIRRWNNKRELILEEHWHHDRIRK